MPSTSRTGVHWSHAVFSISNNIQNYTNYHFEMPQQIIVSSEEQVRSLDRGGVPGGHAPLPPFTQSALEQPRSSQRGLIPTLR